jgi:photosystem II stability/assembly factor-like uncharacterized protein
MTNRGKKLLIGTSKGLIIYERGEKSWTCTGDHFLGLPVSVAWVDERNGAWWAALAHRHWGQKLHRSTNQGKNWESAAVPAYPEGAVLNNGKPATLRKIWVLEQAGPDKPEELLLGTEPGGLFHSTDNGDSWSLVKSLWNHPSRRDLWFGAGRDQPYIHSIVVDPRDSDHYYIAVSCAGVFETTDGGFSWVVRNDGLTAAYLPNPEAEIGHDPHRMFACRSNPDVLWQQNHCGIYRSLNGGKQWNNVGGKEGFPDYGFALAIDHDDPDQAWVIPAVSDEVRVAVDRALCVCQTNDGGETWIPRRNGLPQNYCYDIVFRHSLHISGNCLAFGSTTGNLFLSEDYGESWSCLSHHLPRINYVHFC